jgi:hypothetical protein
MTIQIFIRKYGSEILQEFLAPFIDSFEEKSGTGNDFYGIQTIPLRSWSCRDINSNNMA